MRILSIKKEKNDAAKGKIFTMIGREIAVAVKAGGPDPNNNGKLREVIAKQRLITCLTILSTEVLKKRRSRRRSNI